MPVGVLTSKKWSVLGLRLKMSLGVSVPARARDEEEWTTKQRSLKFFEG